MRIVVSVIVPTFRHCDYVPQTLNSVFSQTFTDHEVIVVNDGSPDDTGAVLRPLAEAGRIKYIEQANAGQAAARNRGLAEARGEYVAFLDDDDLWPADKLAWQVRRLSDDAALSLVGGSAYAFKPDGSRAWHQVVSTGPMTFEQVFVRCPFSSPGQTLIRRSHLEAIGGFDPSIRGADDYDLYMRLIKVGPFFGDGRDALHYRVHDGNASRNYRQMMNAVEQAISKNRPPTSSRRLIRGAYRSLYAYLGFDSTQRLRGALHACHFGDVFREARLLGRFIGPAVRDPELGYYLIRDLAPNWCRGWRRAI
jgi:glycosyltransferase involved in cell wall biosynthesis